MAGKHLLCLVIFCALIYSGTSSGSTYSSVGHVFTAEDARVKSDIKDANIAECAAQIRNLKVKSYKSLLSGTYERGAEVYTNQPGVNEIGIIAQEARTIMPNAVKMVDSKKIFTNPSGKKTDDPTVMSNFLTMDRSKVFMANVAATQFVLKNMDELEKETEELATAREVFNLTISHIKEDLSDVQLKVLEEIRRTAEAETERLKLQKEMNDRRLEEDRKNIDYRIEMERKLILERQQMMDSSHKAREMELIKMREKSEERQEKIRRESTELAEKLRRETELLVQDAIGNNSKTTKRMEIGSDLAKAKLEIQLKERLNKQEIAAERENADIRLQKLKAEGELTRQTYVDGIRAMVQSIESSLLKVGSDPQFLAKIVGAVIVAVSAIYFMRELSKVVASHINRYLTGKPPLVRESSRPASFLALVLSWFQRAWSYFNTHEIDDVDLSDMVLNPSLLESVKRIGATSAAAYKYGAPLRNIMMFGPPGTGKTMCARKLASQCGLEFACMSGGDVAPLGRDATTEIHKLFEWSKSSSRGLLLFIDEAEAFLAKRSRTNMSEDLGNALNALLHHTGTQTNNFMMVLATNRPGDLDSAVVDRIDEALLFDLPSMEERALLIGLYFRSCIANIKPGVCVLQDQKVARQKVSECNDDDEEPKDNTRGRKKAKKRKRTKTPVNRRKKQNPEDIEVEDGPELSSSSSEAEDDAMYPALSANIYSVKGITSKEFSELARKTDGYSGRAISKLMLSINNVMLGSKDKVLTPALFRTLTEQTIQDYERRTRFGDYSWS